ncbi:MAG: hypothetical protein ACOCZ5_00550 [bacterium]
MRDVQMYRGSSSPFDYLVWNGHTLIGIEAKIINDKAQSKSFPFNRVSDEQIEGMLELKEYENSESFILINFRWTNHKKGDTFALDVNEFLTLRDMDKEDKKTIGLNSKSIPLDFFRENVLQLPRLGKGWDLEPLVKERYFYS